MDHSEQLHGLTCPICGAQEFSDFFQAKNIPSQVGVIWPTYELAINAPTGEINLAFCHQCAYIFNKAYDPHKITFADYDFSLHYSNIYQQFNKELVEQLIVSHGLKDKTILDVGCGKGHFLVELCQTGNNQGIGIDPSYEVTTDLAYDPNQITFIQDYFNEAYTEYKVDFITCRHVIDELENPVDFLALLKKCLKSNNKSGIYLEIPNSLKTFSQSLIWNVGYGKRSWFIPYSITYALQLAGYKAVKVREIHEGDYLGIEANPDFSAGFFEEINIEKPFHYFENFTKTYEEGLKEWNELLETYAEKKQQVALWGAGTRGINFLSHFSAIKNLSLVIDISPLRQGKFLPKSGYQVSAPEALKGQNIDVILISNGTYQNEIMHQARALGFSGEFKVF